MLKLALFALAAGASTALAGHQVTINNKCGQAVKFQVPGQGTFSGSHYFNGDANGGVISVGNNCSIDGVGCTSVEFSLNSGVSSADITLIPPHTFNVPVTITLSNGQSKTCSSANCGPSNAFYVPTDYGAQIQESNNPNSGLTATFC